VTVATQLDALHDVLSGRLLQPLPAGGRLDRKVTVGYEALARVPHGPLRSPSELFQAGRAAGRLVELDWLCREQAVAPDRSVPPSPFAVVAGAGVTAEARTPMLSH